MKRLIFGCGYLGFPTAKRWVEAGDQVYAVTRQRDRFPQLSAAGIRPVIGDVSQPESLVELFEKVSRVDTVLWAVGMDRSRYEDIKTIYVEGLQNILDRLPPDIGQFIYISSTGVYGDFSGQWVNENSPTQPTREAGKACLKAEQLIQTSRFASRATVLRFAGIYGAGRVPMRDAVEQKDWEKLSGAGFLNLIHVADGARIIERVAQQQIVEETILVSDGNPVLRTEFYETMAQMLSVGPIEWPSIAQELDQLRRGGNDKRINHSKLCQTVGGTFLYPDYRTGLAAIL